MNLLCYKKNEITISGMSVACHWFSLIGSLPLSLEYKGQPGFKETKQHSHSHEKAGNSLFDVGPVSSVTCAVSWTRARQFFKCPIFIAGAAVTKHQWLVNNRNVLSTALEAGSIRSGNQCGWVPMSTHFWAVDGWILMWLKKEHMSVIGSVDLFYMGTVVVWLDDQLEGRENRRYTHQGELGSLYSALFTSSSWLLVQLRWIALLFTCSHHHAILPSGGSRVNRTEGHRL